MNRFTINKLIDFLQEIATDDLLLVDEITLKIKEKDGLIKICKYDYKNNKFDIRLKQLWDKQH